MNMQLDATYAANGFDVLGAGLLLVLAVIIILDGRRAR
jgi:hypothetical protein